MCIEVCIGVCEWDDIGVRLNITVKSLVWECT